MARQCGTSESTVRRRLDALGAAGALHHHCLPAPRFSGRPVWALVTADVPPLDAAESVASCAACGRPAWSPRSPGRTTWSSPCGSVPSRSSTT
ncbi:hypothetical protein O1L60_17615 [Streptomyces diastatochromogenes]|nr:hypothetical protein [Streptomyces diastatochromogenes]